MLTCEQALELISAQLDGALTAEEAGALDEHLAQCPACRALRADLHPAPASAHSGGGAPPG